MPSDSPHPPSPSAGAIRLRTARRRELEAFARAGYPEEVCGLLVGRTDGRAMVVERVVLARNRNVGRRHDRYELHPDDFLGAAESARRDGLDIVGIWHTHPDHPAQPSATDLEAAWSGYDYLILSVTPRGVDEVRCWTLDGDGFVEQAVEIIQEL